MRVMQSLRLTESFPLTMFMREFHRAGRGVVHRKGGKTADVNLQNFYTRVAQ